MDYKTILMVVILLGLPTIVLVIAKLITIIRQARLKPTESEADVDRLDRDIGDVEFGDGESGKRPSTSNDEIRDSYGNGAGDSQSADPGLTTMQVFDYLEESVTCRDPAGRETFKKLLDEDDSSDDSKLNTKQKDKDSE